MSATLLHGDCADVLMTLPPGSVDLTVTSPPYDNLRKYKGYTFDFEKIARGLWYATKQGGVVVWVVADATINGSETGTSFRQALYFMSLGFRLHDTMIYQTDKPPMNDGRYQSNFEYMFVFSKGKPKTFNPIIVPCKRPGHFVGTRMGANGQKQEYAKRRTGELKVKENIWWFYSGRDANSGTENHPAPFPEDLARDHILSWSNPGDTVLDPMMGSGTTGKMAVLNGRNFIGIDIAAEYVELSRARIEQAVTA